MIENRCNIPDAIVTPEEISKLMRINADIIMQEISDHIDKELKRFAFQIECIKNP